MALKDILFVGDIHGSMDDIFTAFHAAAKNGIKNIVQVGDFWLYGKQELVKMKRVQKRMFDNFGVHVHLHFIDGNHEDFRLINPHLEDTVEIVPDLLFYHPRGTIFEIENVTIGCFGGAVSIDQDFRKPGKTWFDDEFPTMSDISRAMNNFKDAGIDILVTHDIPAYALGQLKFHDGRLDLFGSAKMRDILEVISLIAKAPIIVHGHWHTSAHEHHYVEEPKTGDALSIDVVSLNMNSRTGAIVTIDNTKDSITIEDMLAQ